MLDMKIKFISVYHKEGQWYVAHCPVLGVSSQGRTLVEAETNLKEAMDLYLEDIPTKDLKSFSGKPIVRTIEFNRA